MDALPLVEVQTVLSCMWKAADWLWPPQESTEGPGHRQVLPHGNRDSQVYCVLPELPVYQSDCPGPARRAPQKTVPSDFDTEVSYNLHALYRISECVYNKDINIS